MRGMTIVWKPQEQDLLKLELSLIFTLILFKTTKATETAPDKADLWEV